MREALGFAWRFVAAYACFLAIWIGGLESRYDDALAAASTALLTRWEEPSLTLDVQRRGNALVIRPVSGLGTIPPQELATRRVHSNAALFVALTVAVPGASVRLRALWLLGGGLVLAGTHLAHVLAYAHHHYALHNVGPYYTTVAEDRLWELGWRELAIRPAARARAERLLAADLFNVVGQRVVPIILWLPLVSIARMRPRARISGRTLVALASASVIALVMAACWSRSGRANADAVEDVHLGTSALAAKLSLEGRGYDWIPKSSDAHEAVIDAWPRHGPLTDERYGPRFNWIGIRIAQPPDVVPTLETACVTALATSPSDTKPERIRMATSALAACGRYWSGE